MRAAINHTVATSENATLVTFMPDNNARQNIHVTMTPDTIRLLVEDLQYIQNHMAEKKAARQKEIISDIATILTNSSHALTDRQCLAVATTLVHKGYQKG